MSKKHYVQIAKMFKSVKEEYLNARERRIVNTIMKDFVEIAQDDNPKFDVERFVAACGGYENE